MTKHFLANAKAYVALIGAIASGLLGVYGAHSTVGQILTVLAILGTAVGTYATPNQSQPPNPSGE